jgi:cyclopropane-fatty-acyl-phospholipid synthase
MPALDRWCRRVLLKSLSRVNGRVHLVEPTGTLVVGQGISGEDVEVRVNRSTGYRQMLLGGTTGAAEGFILNHWDTDALVPLIEMIVDSPDVYRELDSGWAFLSECLNAILHKLNRNTRTGSLRNIMAHYDLGNDFFSLFLDETMAYSCGYFERVDSTLKEASVTKFDRLCRKLCLKPADHLIEIGTGWGGLAMHAARHFGCRVTTTTISEEQFAEAQRRVTQAGLADRIHVIKKDYRELEGVYDKLVSVEMIEAVGHQYLDSFFRTCNRLLKPHGLMALQAITIPDQHFARHRRTGSFINKYIFPGSCLLSSTAICDCIARVTDLRLIGLEDITSHYVRTLRAWRETFMSRLDDARKLNLSEAFLRMWHFYLAYCEAAFACRWNGDVQMVFAKPRCREDPLAFLEAS